MLLQRKVSDAAAPGGFGALRRDPFPEAATPWRRPEGGLHMFRDSRRAVALVTAGLLVPSWSAYAGAAFKAVWYPNGNVTYKIASDAHGADDAIHDTMRYMSEHPPL